ncbi:hypothetical protein HY837_06695 [archaeon]|nr:hypothetical protein [archaeon]
MRYLIPRTKNIWVASQREETVLRDRILNADVCLSDMDDTDTQPTARLIITTGWKRYFLNPKFISWLINEKLRNNGKDSWRNYKNFFIDEEERERIKQVFTLEIVKNLLLPGVEEFYSLLKCPKVYISRNLQEIVSAVGETLKFDEVRGESLDKEKEVEQFIEKNPHFKHYIVKGDSHYDEGMLNALKFYKERGKIEEYTSIWVSKEPNLSDKFDVNIGYDYTGLVDLLNK